MKDDAHITISAYPSSGNGLDRISVLEQYEAAPRNPSQTAIYQAAIQQLREQIGASGGRYDMERDVLLRDGMIYPAIHFAGRNRVIFARRVLELGGKINSLGVFELPPSAKLPGTSRLTPYELNMLRLINNIFAVSPDGRWAASGTHIYDVNTLKPVRKLPFTCAQMVFSNDGATLFMYSVEKECLYTLADWQKNAPPVEAAPQTP